MTHEKLSRDVLLALIYESVDEMAERSSYAIYAEDAFEEALRRARYLRDRIASLRPVVEVPQDGEEK